MNTFLPGAQDSPVLAAVNAGVMMAWSSFGQDAGGLGCAAGCCRAGGVWCECPENLDNPCRLWHPMAVSNS